MLFELLVVTGSDASAGARELSDDKRRCQTSGAQLQVAADDVRAAPLLATPLERGEPLEDSTFAAESELVVRPCLVIIQRRSQLGEPLAELFE